MSSPGEVQRGPKYNFIKAKPVKPQPNEALCFDINEPQRMVERQRTSEKPVGLSLPLPQDFLTVVEAATLLRIAVTTLGRWRIAGTGLIFRKFGRRVVYARSDLLAWTDAQQRLNTSGKPEDAFQS